MPISHEVDLKIQSDLKELKLEAGKEHMWKTRPWPASQEKKFRRPAAISFWENFCVQEGSGDYSHCNVKVLKLYFKGEHLLPSASSGFISLADRSLVCYYRTVFILTTFLRHKVGTGLFLAVF